MGRGWLRYLTVVTGVSVVVVASPPTVDAAGNAGLHVHKTVDASQLAINPNLNIALGVDKATAIPGDTLTYTAVVTNPTATFGMGGDINAEAIADADATVAYYWDELQACAIDCGNGMGNPNWIPVATFEAGQPGYVPVEPPALHSGMDFSAQSMPRSGVTYPAIGDQILGTVISSTATAGWTYKATVTLGPAQIAALSDLTRTQAVRNVLHFEVTIRNTSAAQPYTDPELFANPFTSAPNPGTISNVAVAFTLPDGTVTTVPASPAALSPGGSGTATAQFKVPVPDVRGAGETEGAYVSRLHHLDGSSLVASASATGTGFSGTVSASSSPVSTTELVPIVSIAKSGPTTVDAGTTETNPLSLLNMGGAPASGLVISDNVPGGTNGAVSGTPASIAPGATASATASYPVPQSQAEGTLTDTAVVSWQDANGNPYGTMSSSFTTTVHNVLLGASLTLAPVSAGPNTPGTPQTLTATLLDSHGNPIPNKAISFSVTGANPGTGTSLTDVNGIATFTYTGVHSGNDVAIASVVAPGFNITSNTSTIVWGKPLQPVALGPVQGTFFPNPDQNNCVFSATPASTPLFSQTFPDILFDPAPGIVPHDISSVTGFTRPFTDLTTDVNGNYNGQIIAQGNGIQAGSTAINFFAVFTGNFIVNQPGDITFTILHDDGYILGVGGGATRVSGDLNNEPAATPFQGYQVAAAWNVSSQGSSSSGADTIHFPAAGSYPFELDYTECQAGPLFLVLETTSFVAQTDPLSVYVGYADGLRGGSAFPFPWNGSPNTTFQGCTNCTFDGGAIRLDNNGPTPITFDSVTVDIAVAPGVNYCPSTTHFDIWPHNVTLPPGQIMILAPLASGFSCSPPEVFDGSDTSFYCGPDTGVIPQVNITVGGVTKTFADTTQVLNTGGFDKADCGGNESHPWARIGGGGTPINLPLPPAVTLNLMPFNVPNAIQGQTQTLTVSAMDGTGNPQANLAVSLQVTGANTQLLNATTGPTGLATFSYLGVSTGSDQLQASAFIMGLQSTSNLGSVTWNAVGGAGGGLGPSITNPSPADGSVITKPVAVNATIAAPAGHSITSWRVFYQAAGGGPQVVIGSGTGAPPSPLGVTFDPTVLINGVYTLTVEATSDNGAVQDVSSGVTVYGGLKLGRYQTTFQDMSVGVAGYEMQVLRTYDSTDKSNGDFGVGWHVAVNNFRVSSNHTLGAGGWSMYNTSCTLGLCLTAYKNVAPRYVVVRYPDGHSEVFDFSPNGGTNIFWTCTPVFTARGTLGSTSTLVPLDDTSCSYTGDGNIYGASGPYNPQRFRLTTHTGQVLILDARTGLVSMTDRNGNSITVDTNGVHASSGQSITFTRDASGRITRMTGPSSQTLTYAYSASGDLVSSTDPVGNVNAYTYDSSHDLLSVTGPQGVFSTETFDSSGRLTSITDASGHTTQIQSDPGAQTMTFIDALGTTTTVQTADDMGNVSREDISFGGQTTTLRIAHDTAGHPTQTIDALGNTTSSSYDAQGDIVSFTDALGHKTNISYNAFGQATSIVAPDGSVTESLSYDNNGNLTSLLGAGGSVVHYSYDSSGNAVSRTDALGNTANYAYDSSGHLLTSTTPTGKSTGFTYDANGQLTSITDALGGVEHLFYDAAGHLTSITDALGSTQSYTYDSLGKVTSATDPLGRTTFATYDADGKTLSTTNRDGQVTNFTYDADGRLIHVSYPGGEFLAQTFDGIGRPLSIANSSATVNNTYDLGGHLTSTTETAPSIGSATLSYTYDAAGDRVSATGPDGTVNYAYDSLSRVVRVTDPSGRAFGIQYDSSSRVTGLTRPNGVNDAYTYDSNGRLVGITSTLNGVPIQTLTQTVDANGQVITRSDAAGTVTFTHDAIGRLVSVNGPGSASQAYTYDAAGNRTSGPESTSNTFNASDELASDSNFTYTYNAEGDRLTRVDRSGATTRYTYNGARQLTSIQYPDGTTTAYTYDPLGRRLSVSSGGATTSYVYDGLNTRLEYGSAGLAASYIQTSQADHPLEMTRGGNSYYYLQDLQGSVIRLTDSGGAVANSYAYDAFGNPTSTSSTVSNPFTYNGREFDAKSGLYYNRARYYDPASGSFLGADPLSALQPYSYVSGDPVDFTDPSGAQEMVQTAAVETWDMRVLKAIKTGACAAAFGSAVLEVALDALGAQTPNHYGLISIGVGVGTACVMGALGVAEDPKWAIIFLPLLAGVVAAVFDFLEQLWCATHATRAGVTVSWQHAVIAGLMALGLGAGTAALAEMAVELGGSSMMVAVGNVLLTGDLSAIADMHTAAGACG